VIHDVASDIESGMSLSAALTRYSDVFSIFYINLIKAGEAAGDMEATLNYLADHLEENMNWSKR